MNKLIRIKEALWVVAMFGLVAMVLRMLFGLGATTHLTDAMPWGLWKIFNMVAGVALATGGFTLACIVYIFHLKKYRSLLKPAILVAFLGYGVSAFSLLWDIGIPYRIWHPLVPSMWNPHSFLFEVAWCVMLYFMVSFIELTPTLLEKSPFQKVGHFIHKISLPVVILGITLSTMHHTSLGSIFLVSPSRLHPLWYTGNWLPFQFFVSAVGAGMMTVVFVSLAYSWLFNREPDIRAVGGVARASSYFLVLFFAMRIAEITSHGKWGYVFSGHWEGYMFILEIMLQAVIPIVILSSPENRRKPSRLAVAALITMSGLVLMRLNTGIGGYARWLGSYYFPSLTEFAFSLGVYAAAGLVFLFVAEHFDVFDKTAWKPRPEPVPMVAAPDWGAIAFTRLSFTAVITVPIAVLVFSAGSLQSFQPIHQPVAPPVIKDKTEQIMLLDGNNNKKAVIFPHKLHVEMLTDEKGCATCHHVGKPNNLNAPCYKCHSDMVIPQSIFDHAFHEKHLGGNNSCQQCHDLKKPITSDNHKTCYDCHEKDMGLKKPPEGQRYNEKAIGYVNALHTQCRNCHKTCTTCHHPKECGPGVAAKTQDCSACH